MNSVLKGIWLFFLLGNLYAQPISHIVFFGDSLTDNGNLYRATFHIFPPSPPYFNGRFTNGPTWAEKVGQFYQSKYGIDYAIYAWAGATAAFHLPSSTFIAPTTLGAEVNRYLFLSLFQDRSSVLFVIWIGDNDYLFFNGPDSKVIAGVTDAIKKLIRFGAKKFLILNLTDASLTPYSQSNGNASTLHQMIMLH